MPRDAALVERSVAATRVDDASSAWRRALDERDAVVAPDQVEVDEPAAEARDAGGDLLRGHRVALAPVGCSSRPAVTLTDAGEALHAQVVAAFARLPPEIARLGEPDRAALRDLLARMLAEP